MPGYSRQGLRAVLLAAGAIAIAAAPHATAQTPAAAPWPHVGSPLRPNPAMEARITKLLAAMSDEDKVAQIVQPDLASVSVAEMHQYHFGSILTGGNSGPNGNDKAPAPEWLAFADSAWDAIMKRDDGRPAIPPIWGIDAVHGHANIIGATIFPQNVGLGAMRDPDLIRRIGVVTAKEMAVTGIDWDFSPTLAVVRDTRWGRSYEGFSEDPSIVRSYAGAMIEGLQGKPGTKEFLRDGKVIATAKHFVGDGGTANGVDQGDNPSSPEQIRDIHGAGYPPAIGAGVQAVMASFSSVRGQKLSADRDLLTGALREQMEFDGLTVGDWNAHGQVPGCSNTSCAAAINAGMDMVMAPDSWKGFYASTLAQVRSGEISHARLDEAVRRILRVKLRAGMFDKGRPSSRPFAGRFDLLGSPEHRAVARQAVRESLVLLKNQGQVLPLSPKLNLLVAGDGADNIPKQAGGWTISWQGTGTTNADFPHAQSIFAGIAEATRSAGGSATLSVDGSFTAKPDAAIVVFGEDPYAEFAGDRPTLEYRPGDTRDLDLLKKLKAQGIPVVSVFLSGRPLWVNPEINASDAFVAAFLPGGEGGGIADVLLADARGKPRHDFHGKLSYSWPKRIDQSALHHEDAGYDPLFAFGYGLTYADKGDLAPLPEAHPANATREDGMIFGRGKLPANWSFDLAEPHGVAVPVKGNSGTTGGGMVRISGVDRSAQEDARALVWGAAGGTARIVADKPIDISRESNAQYSLIVDYRIDTAPASVVRLGMQCGDKCGGTVPLTATLRAAPVGQWTTLTLPLPCLAKAGLDPKRVTAPFTLESDGALALSISGIHYTSAGAGDACPQ
ncbi:exo 1,3/1,4-beta-D-glucan glucohydrolase [Sphingomonas oligophenolica]|uniref:Exo 1,3/1,4-beta-D-glucan glucohydrolase n=1 Tax=Sphingomonas oligophenolica TaxID=301154 RepID=A0ABU9Y498_9SPHN